MGERGLVCMEYAGLGGWVLWNGRELCMLRLGGVDEAGVLAGSAVGCYFGLKGTV